MFLDMDEHHDLLPGLTRVVAHYEQACLFRVSDGNVVAGGVVRPPVHGDDRKYSAKHNERRVLSRPTRTVFGISVQVEADSSDVFVKPRTEDRE